MPEMKQRQGSITLLSQRVDYWAECFLFDRKAQNMAPGTMQYYQVKLKTFCAYCESQSITEMGQLTANDLRRFMAFLEETGHSAGGRHALYRAIKTFLRWYEEEAEPENWRNPIRKVKPPIVPVEPLDPIPVSHVELLEKSCDKSFLGSRDRAIILTLLDTGLRAQELLDLQLSDIDLMTGTVQVRKGKGRKPRGVFLGVKSRRAIRSYLKFRQDDLPNLWVTDDQQKELRYFGLRSIITRRAAMAKIKAPGLHAFRRQFALTMLRAGTDLVTLSRLMGHSTTAILARYLQQIPDDLQAAHRKAGPVDSGGF